MSAHWREGERPRQPEAWEGIVIWARRWLLVAFGLPVAAWVLDRGAELVEERRGRSDLTQGMHGVADRMRGFRNGGRRQRRRR
jgi:hypothetical protein